LQKTTNQNLAALSLTALHDKMPYEAELT
jgi:hypothetical protein